MAKKLPVKTLILNLGYCETESMASVVLTHEDGFKTTTEAMASFAEIFRISNPEPASCCKENMKVESARFCSQCGVPLAVYSSMAEIDIEEDVRAFLTSDVDGAGGSYNLMEDAGWHMGYNLVDMKRAYLVFETPAMVSEILNGRPVDDYYVVRVSK